MTRSLVLPSLLAASLAASLLGCKEEPTIVITFAPQDLGGARPRDLGHPPDLSRAPDMAQPPVAADACKKDADCVLVVDGCCPCNQGGKMIAVAKAKAASHKSNCDGILCAQMISHDPSCGAAPACEAGHCAYRLAKGKKKPEGAGPM